MLKTILNFIWPKAPAVAQLATPAEATAFLQAMQDEAEAWMDAGRHATAKEKLAAALNPIVDLLGSGWAYASTFAVSAPLVGPCVTCGLVHGYLVIVPVVEFRRGTAKFFLPLQRREASRPWMSHN